MPGTRSLSFQEERRVVLAARHAPSHARMLVALQLFAGYRLREALALRVRDVWQDGAPVQFVHRPPHPLDRHRRAPLPLPVSNELTRTIRAHITGLEQGGVAKPESVLFPGEKRDAAGNVLPIDRRTGLRLVRRVLAKAEVFDDGRLGTHVLRKTFARKLFLRSGRNLMLLRDALGHASVRSTDDYIESLRDAVEAAILKADWTTASSTS